MNGNNLLKSRLVLTLFLRYKIIIPCNVFIYKGLLKFKVIPAGLEPTTTRTGIWHSIQLNYGTKKASV